ncbi:leucyl aminopeptidase [Nanoarchaeota archaeon]
MTTKNQLEITLSTEQPEKIEADILIIAETGGKSEFQKYLKEAVKTTKFESKFNKTATIYCPISKTKPILLLGKGDNIDQEKTRQLANTIIKTAKARKAKTVAVEFSKGLNDKSIKALTEGIVLGNYEFDKYKSEDKEDPKIPVKEVIILLKNSKNKKNLQKIIQKTQIICNNTNYARDLVNDNADTVNSLFFEAQAKEIAKLTNVKTKIIEEKEMKRLGMNLLLAVSRGSEYTPKLIILEYKGNKASKDKTAIVGKGITFDSGGLNLKPAGYIETMKQDMGGAAAVIATIKAAAELKLKKNIIGVIAACENIVDGKAYKPGDVFKAYSGKTVEILNTDAEGRLILADALAYTEKNIKPKTIIDIATLTGAASVCLGSDVSPIMTKDEKLAKKLFDAGENTYERVWQLPLYDDYKDHIKSDIADIKNLGKSKGNAGTIIGGIFLQNFVEKTTWAHIDIAGSVWLDNPRSYSPKNASGVGVRLLIEFFS